MPSVIGLGGSGVLNQTESTIFDASVDVISAGVKPCAAIVTVDNGTGLAFIRNPTLNGASNWYPMAAGQSKDFIVGRAGGVGQLFGKSDAAGTTISGGPTGAN